MHRTVTNPSLVNVLVLIASLAGSVIGGIVTLFGVLESYLEKKVDPNQIVKLKENTTNQKDKLIKEKQTKKEQKEEKQTKGELTKEEEFRVFYNIYTIYSI